MSELYYSRQRDIGFIPRSRFDLSHEVKFTGDMGYLYPILLLDCIPGDYFKIDLASLIKFSPMLSPVYHNIKVSVYYFFVPYRILWDQFEDFITKGRQGTTVISIPSYPRERSRGVGTLWDYFGFPVGYLPPDESTEVKVNIFPWRAYAKIYNEYFRDNNLQGEIDEIYGPEYPLKRNWKKDYFTSALPFRQRGIDLAVPVSGTFIGYPSFPIRNVFSNITANLDATNVNLTLGLHYNGSSFAFQTYSNLRTDGTYAVGNIQSTSDDILQSLLNGTPVTGTLSSSMSLHDFRFLHALQQWMEKNARFGVRYIEFLKAHFGVSPSDARLQRPEYIGGVTRDVIINEVLQTTPTTTPLGNSAGVASGVVTDMIVDGYEVKEFGLIMGLMSVYPKNLYSQGIFREWTKTNVFDFYFPLFANLSEQAIYNYELYVDGTADDKNVFGFQGMYDHYRVKHSYVTSLFRPNVPGNFAHWHLSRHFTNRPFLNLSFIECNPSKRVFSVPSEPALFVSVGNIIDVYRPLPAFATPSL